MLPGGIHRTRKRLEEGLDYVVGFVTVQELQMQIAARLVREPLKKLARQAKARSAGNILILLCLGNLLL